MKAKIETEGFTGWTKKEGVHGVSPSEEILKDIVTIRVLHIGQVILGKDIFPLIDSAGGVIA